ncbi:transporter substrate-binding domain-containing protein [Pseudoalteromonas sp. JBTF-M23]|uniref:Transporter substrate-binding domain-containing protein n=1 Tax=Pseudoalteromonas caenipelagi TaxID=2726988 RepID=A0A849VBY4_9GAMM|nr:transporter substrate-binding domain-containing protein [Pseudoalteromonas caenipelagi]NOU50083.1 transporter substrate-binding domain-containing protein [Pseudoalteromonas caenipelagi]
MTFCYEDKELAPSYMGVGLNVPKVRPGVSIEVLQTMAREIDGLDIQFVREPWQRCLHDLKRNKVDAVIASYREERKAYMVFPTTESGELDIQLALNQFGRCLVGDSQFIEELRTTKDSFNLAIPRGYSSAKSLDDTRYIKVDTLSQLDAFDLVNKRVVDGTIGLCMINGKAVKAFPYATKLQAYYPPFDTSFGFLTYSQLFYKNNEALAKRLWQQLAKFPFADVYMEYLASEHQQIDSYATDKPSSK